MPRPALAVAAAATLLAACTGSQSLHPPAPPVGQIPPLADPAPSRVVIHATIFADAIRQQLEERLPKEGSGEVPVVAGQRAAYRWTRDPVELRFDRGRLVVSTHAVGHVRVFGDIPITLSIAGEPVITADYQAQLQSIEVNVKGGSSIDTINAHLEAKLRELLGGIL